MLCPFCQLLELFNKGRVLLLAISSVFSSVYVIENMLKYTLHKKDEEAHKIIYDSLY